MDKIAFAGTQLEFTLEVKVDEGQYIAKCVELGTASCGDSKEEALDNLREAIDLHLETLDSVGELKRYLRRRGILLEDVSDESRGRGSAEAIISTEGGHMQWAPGVVLSSGVNFTWTAGGEGQEEKEDKDHVFTAKHLVLL